MTKAGLSALLHSAFARAVEMCTITHQETRRLTLAAAVDTFLEQEVRRGTILRRSVTSHLIDGEVEIHIIADMPDAGPPSTFILTTDIHSFQGSYLLHNGFHNVFTT